MEKNDYEMTNDIKNVNEEMIKDQNNSEVNEISIKDIFYILKKHLIIIIVLTVLGAIAGFTYNKVKAPEFKSTATILASYEDRSSDKYSTSDYNYLDYLSKTFVQLVTEDAVLDNAASKLDVTRAELKSGLSVSCNSLIISVSYTGEDPEKTKKVVDTVVDSLVEVSNQKDGDKYVYKLLGGNLVVLSYSRPGAQISHTVRNIAIFALIGLVISLVYAFCFELFNNKFKTQQEVERALGLPILSEVLYYELDKNVKNTNAQPKENALEEKE